MLFARILQLSCMVALYQGMSYYKRINKYEQFDLCLAILFMIYHWVYAKWSGIYYAMPENSCKLFLGMQNGIIGIQSIMVIVIFMQSWKI